MSGPLYSGDPVQAMRAAKTAALPLLQPSPTATLTVYDPYYRVLDWDCSGRYLELHLQDPRQALPAGSLALDGGDWLAPFVLNCDTVVVPVIYNKGGYRWSGRVDVAHDQMKDGLQKIQCELVGDKTWLDRILAWPAPELPIFIQWPGEWFAIGPAVTVIHRLISEQAQRLQLHLWELVNNVTSQPLLGWFADLLYGGEAKPADIQQALVTPICVIPVDGFADESAWIEINGRMDTLWKLVQQQLIDNGIDIDCTMWVPGDPQPEGLWFPLTVATCVVRITNRSGFTGPWGPFEGLAIDLVQLEGSLLGNALAPLLNPNNVSPYLATDLGEYVAPALGVNFTPPTCYFNLDALPESGNIEYDITHHAPLARQVVIGGQSPKVCALSGN